MKPTSPPDYWNSVYQTKPTDQVSWYEAYPHRSVATIEAFGLPKTARILDVGGGDSRLVDALLERGYRHLTVLDISAAALERAKKRLGNRARQIEWLISDVTSFAAGHTFDVWHDRATFHFLTEPKQVDSYLSVAGQSLGEGGFLAVGTFSEQGPSRCSGLPVRQYSAETLTAQFARGFSKLGCQEAGHATPTGVVQQFTFCQFQRHL